MRALSDLCDHHEDTTSGGCNESALAGVGLVTTTLSSMMSRQGVALRTVRAGIRNVRWLE